MAEELDSGRDAEKSGLPKCSPGLLISDLDQELLVYNPVTKKAHCLNESAALVFRACQQGSTSLQETAAQLGSLEAVHLALRDLAKFGLVEKGRPWPAGTSRRGLLKAAGLLLAIPTVSTIAAPTPAMAVSCTTLGMPCTGGPGQGDCCAGTLACEGGIPPATTCCVTTTGSCAAPSDCCGINSDCTGLNGLFPFSCCSKMGSPCTIAAECCPGGTIPTQFALLCVGVCCIGLGNSCAPGDTCCSGAICDLFTMRCTAT